MGKRYPCPANPTDLNANETCELFEAYVTAVVYQVAHQELNPTAPRHHTPV
jgi:hypothetical protein